MGFDWLFLMCVNSPKKHGLTFKNPKTISRMSVVSCGGIWLKLRLI